MYFSAPLVAAMVMAMLPSALAAPSTNAGLTTREPTLILGTVATEVEARALSALYPDVEETEEGGLAKRSYMGSCSQCEITNGNTLRCYCSKPNGGKQWSNLNLNKCLANRSGKIAWAINGGYQGSCSGYALYNYKNFGTWCKKGNSAADNYSSINLDEKIHNRSGIIGCTV